MGKPWLHSAAYRGVVDSADDRRTATAWGAWFEENMHAVPGSMGDLLAGAIVPAVGAVCEPTGGEMVSSKEWFRANRDRWYGVTLGQWVDAD